MRNAIFVRRLQKESQVLGFLYFCIILVVACRPVFRSAYLIATPESAPQATARLTRFWGGVWAVSSCAYVENVSCVSISCTPAYVYQRDCIAVDGHDGFFV